MFLALLKLYSFMNAYEYSEEATSDKHDFIIIIFCYDWQHFDILTLRVSCTLKIVLVPSYFF